MKKFIFLLIALCSFTVSAQELQRRSKVTISLNTVNTVVINGLSGDCSVFQSSSNELGLKAGLYTSGVVRGWKFPKERPVFAIKYKQSKDTLYVEMPKAISFRTIGISTYSETVKNVLHIPADKHIIFRKAYNLTICDEFEYLETQNINNLTCKSISKSNTYSVICNATRALSINGENRNLLYEYRGIGSARYQLKAKNIVLTIR